MTKQFCDLCKEEQIILFVFACHNKHADICRDCSEKIMQFTAKMDKK